MNATTSSHALKASDRSLTGKKVRQLRRQGEIPAVVYGHKQESASLSVNAHDFAKLFREAGSTTLIDLSVDGKKPQKVLIHDVQFGGGRGSILHVDFYQVNMKEKLRTEVPLEFVGTADAIEIEGGSLLVVKDSVEVECLPDNLIQEISVDISSLKGFADAIRVKDLPVPTGVEILDDPEEMIASVSEPRSEQELEELSEKPDATITTEVETASGTDAEKADEEDK